MKPANDPNRQQPPSSQVPVRPQGANVRTTSGPTVTSQSVVTTNVTSHIVSTGNPALAATIKNIPVTTSRVVPHSSGQTLTLVGPAPGLRPVTAATGITNFRGTLGTIAAPRGAVGTSMMRNIVTTPSMTSAGSAGPNFASGIRAVPRPPAGMTTVTTAVQPTWAAKTVATTPSKVNTGMPTFPVGQAPRPTSSVTVTTRPVTSATVTRPELTTLRTTKPAGTPDKFVRTPARALTFAAPVSGGPFQAGTHLTVAQMPSNQSSSTPLTLQPIVVNTTGIAKAGGTPRQTGLHPIGPKVITQPTHGPAMILTNVSGKPGGQGVPAGALQLTRGPAPQASGGALFTTAPGGAQVKVLTQAPPGTLLSDVLSQQAGTTLLPSSSVFIQATTQHTSVNVTPLERGTVVTSANYTALPYISYDASGTGGNLIATGTSHQPISHGGLSHQLIRTFAPTVAQGGVTTMQVQAATFQQADEAARRSSNVSSSGGNTMTGARPNPVMLVEASRPAVNPPTTKAEGTSDTVPQQQNQPQSGHSSHSTMVSQAQSSQQPTSHHQIPQHQALLQTTTAAASQPGSSSVATSISLSLPNTPSTTPSKFCASPRPSILRKREHDGSPSKAQKNLLAALSSVASMSSLPSSLNSSPPPSPPARPDSRDDHKDGNGHSSAGSSTISATSSPGLPCDGDNNGNSQSGLPIKPEPADLAEASSNNGTNGNSDAMSPRKKPRKQQLTGNELQEPPYSDENVEFSEDKIKKEEGNHKPGQDASTPSTPSRSAAAVAARRRPSVSLLQTYRTCWKPRNNHFLRPTDVRPREERRLTVAELSSQKMVVQRAQGWKLHHLSTQMEEMSEREMDVLDQLSDVLNVMEAPKAGVEPNNKDLNRTNELIRSNIQRSKVVRSQLEEVRVQLLRLLDHTSPVIDIIKRNANRRQAKKKY